MIAFPFSGNDCSPGWASLEPVEFWRPLNLVVYIRDLEFLENWIVYGTMKKQLLR